jgi:excisionase family DNA binding protein
MTKTEILADGLERVSQSARRLGIDRNTVYAWIREGKIPYLEIHGVYRIPSRAVTEMLEKGLRIGDPK